MPSRKPGYRDPVSLMGQTLGSAPLIPCPLLGLHRWWGAGSLNNLPLIMACSSISESLSTPVFQNMLEENTTAIRTGGSLSSRWTSATLSQNYRRLFLIRPFAVAAGIIKTVRLLRNGHLLLEVASAVQSQIVNNLDNLAGCPVTASPHRTLNTCKGVFRCAQLVDCDEEKTLRELKPQGVLAITNITVKDDSGGTRNTNTFIITFKTSTIPKHLHIGYLRLSVSTYIPNPLCCFNCQKFGHGKNACTTSLCKCGQVGHISDHCTSEPKCLNCNGNHSAFHKNCPEWLFEQKVQQVKAERGISFIEAHKIVSTESEGRPAQGGCSTAAVVASKSGSTQPTTPSLQVQTDLTWPEGQKVPSVLPPSASSTCQHTHTTTDKLSSNNPGKWQSSQSPPHPSSSNKNNFNAPHSKPPDKGKKIKRPKLNRPPKSDSEIPTSKSISRWTRRPMTVAPQNQTSQTHFLTTMANILQWNIRGLQANKEKLHNYAFILHSSHHYLSPGDLSKGKQNSYI